MRAQDIVKNLEEFIRRIPIPVLIGIASLFLLLGVAITIYNISKAKKQEIKWGVLYTDLKSPDVSKIIDELERMKIPYKLSDTADTIFVPQELIPDIRNTLATKGLPQERAGLEIFEKPKFGLTEFMQKVNYQRAIQGELERTITKINCVENARVHISFPEKKLFTEEQKEPTASVMLWITPGCTLPPGSIKGIVHLVSFAVEGLKKENVTVVDQRGRVLHPIKQDENFQALEATQIQLEIERQFERNLEEKLTELLEKSIGPGKVGVKVDADLDYTKVKRVSERYDPLETAVRSEHIIDERFKGIGAVPVGPPGTRQNVPPEIGIEPLPGKSEYERQERIRNYEISKIVEHVEEEVGDIKRISVAVMVDGQYDIEWRNGKPYVKFIPLPDEELAKIRSFVESAVGINPQRGDQISVVSVPFESSVRYAERLAMLQLTETSKERAIMYKWLAIAAIGFFISLYLIFKKLFERRLPQEVEVVIPKYEKPPPPPEAVPPIEIKIEEVRAPEAPPPTIEVAPPVIPEIIIPEKPLEIPVIIPEIKIPSPPPSEGEVKPPPVEEVKLPPVEEVKPPPVEELKPSPPPPEEVVVEEIRPLVEEKPHVEEIRVPTIEIVPPIEIPEVEIAAHPPVPEIDLESAISVAKDIIKENKELALYIIKKWLSER
ncbi:MAG: flagellar basal-body MS-ring/collar protein FliF [Candidatus Calescibacterium sp.]